MNNRLINSAFAFGAIIGFVTLAAPALSQQNTPERPLVFIPGIIGSVLSEEDGSVVWGNLGSLRSGTFHKLDLLPASGEAVPLKPTDALRDFPLLFGAFEVGLYSGIIDFLIGKTTISDRISGNTFKGNYVEGQNLFVFAYDWRRSNFANALKLDAFIQEKIPSGEYDLIAHSMGGLVTRIMLSQEGPNDLCTTGGTDHGGLSPQDYQTLCNAVYGLSPSGSWPSAHLDERRAAADRMHTFIEMAVPHYGSVNLASTLLEGWGKVSELLLGGKRKIQNTVLSLAAPVELLPTYENCCAQGVAYAVGNTPIDPYDEEYWMELLLAFGKEPCPYDRCEIRQALFRNGIENRKIIDRIMDSGLPGSVKANHGIIGRKVKNTREVVYVKNDAPGDGKGVSYRVNGEGDGTVHRLSALLPHNSASTYTNISVVMRASHPFIVGDEAATTYVYNMLVEPIDEPIAAVSGALMEFAGGAVDQIGLDVSNQVLLVDRDFDLFLEMNQQDGDPFDVEQVEAAQIAVSVVPVSPAGDPFELPALTLDQDYSMLESGSLVFTGDGYSIPQTGVYTIVVGDGVTVLARKNIYVLEE